MNISFNDYGFDLNMPVLRWIIFYCCFFIAISYASYVIQIKPIFNQKKVLYFVKVFFSFLGYLFLGFFMINWLTQIYYFRILGWKSGGVLGIPSYFIVVSEITGIIIGLIASFVISKRNKKRPETISNLNKVFSNKTFIFIVSVIFPGAGFTVRSIYIVDGFVIILQIALINFFPIPIGLGFFCIILIIQVWIMKQKE